MQAERPGLKVEDLRRQVDEAKEMPGQQNAIRRLRLNEWTEQVTRWLGAPGNLTLETASDLLIGLGAILDPVSLSVDSLIVKSGQEPPPVPSSSPQQPRSAVPWGPTPKLPQTKDRKDKEGPRALLT